MARRDACVVVQQRRRSGGGSCCARLLVEIAELKEASVAIVEFGEFGRCPKDDDRLRKGAEAQ